MLVVVMMMMIMIIIIMAINRKYINIETSYIEVHSMWSIKTKLISVNAAAASLKSFRK